MLNPKRDNVRITGIIYSDHPVSQRADDQIVHKLLELKLAQYLRVLGVVGMRPSAHVGTGFAPCSALPVLADEEAVGARRARAIGQQLLELVDDVFVEVA